MIEYAQLHCHTKYSVQDAIPSHKDYVDAIYKHNQASSKYKCLGYVATEHGTLFGITKSAEACLNPDAKERALKPVYGSEVYMVEDLATNPNPVKERYHLILIAKNETGLKNLYKIVSHAGMNSFKPKQKAFPITDITYMKDHGEGIICLTACVAGMVPNLILNGDMDGAEKLVKRLNNIFDEVYLEVQPHDFPEQLIVNNGMINLASITGNKLVMTCDSHYINASDSQYHDILKDMCHQRRFTVTAHLKTGEEMEEFCINNNIPLEAISNSAEIFKQCNVTLKPEDHNALLPIFPCPKGHNPDTCLRELCFDSIQERIIRNGITEPKKYIKQLIYELDVICNAGFASYFLILWDWFKWCRENDILCGAGRGCFEPEMMVSLENGYCKPIKDVQPGEYVINGDGNSNKVLFKHEYDIKEQMTEINICGNNIKCTNDHKILTLITEKCANGSQKNIYCKDKCRIKSCKFRKRQELNWVEASKLKKGDMLAYPKPKLHKKNIYSVDLSKYGNTDNINSNILINRDFAEFIGLYLGNGWLIMDDKYRKYAVGNAFQPNCKDKINRYTELVNKVFGNNIKVSLLRHKTRNIVQLMFYNKTIVNFMNDICGHYALHKRIPDLLLVNDNDCIKSLMIGMMDTDGCYKDSQKIVYSSINYGMISQLKMLFAHLGYYGSITERIHKKHDWHNEYKLQIGGKQLYTLKADFLKKIIIGTKKYTRNDFLQDDKYFYFKVLGISHYDYTGKVYDLNVENNHTYMINNSVVHNSAAGSIVSYLLNITKIDPIKNGFFFERFLSPSRLEFPDIDTDIPRDKRAEAISYLLSKYGKENVSQIITYGEYKLKNTTKAIMSNLGCSFTEQNEITRDIPDMIDGKQVNYDLIEKVATDSDNEKYSSFTDGEKKQLKKMYDKYQELFQKYPSVYHGLKHICGCISNTGIHAGGVILCNKNITESAAIIDGGDTAVLPLIQLEMSELDYFGFLKIDALGLKTLDIIKETMRLSNLGYDWYDSEDYSDQSVYDMLKSGETTDVFQLSAYMPTTMLVDFDAKTLSDLSAINAGNRPGPLEKNPETGKSMVDLYIERKKTGIIESIHPDIDPILQETMGCIWFQEQSIALGKVMAGYDAGAADQKIRKTIGKKILKKIPEIRNEFIYGKKSIYDEDHNVIGISEEDSEYCEGALARGFSMEICQNIFTTMEAMGKYSFNKSHSSAYSVLSYKCAYLSKHFPVEFAVANCTVNKDQEAITATLSLAKKRKIPIYQPDINKSDTDFSVDNGGIRYGLKAIKGLGDTTVKFLDKFRKNDNAPFKDFDDFYNRIHNNNGPVVSGILDNLRKSTGKSSSNPIKKDVEVALILSGAFDFCEPNRYKLLNHYMLNIRSKESVVKFLDTDHTLPLDEKKYVRKIKLALEKHYMGTYISEHPLDPFPYYDFESAQEGEVIETTGIVTGVTSKSTKKGNEYLSVKFKAKDDIERSMNVFDDKIIQNIKSNVKKNQIVVIKGKVSKKYNNLNATSVRPVAFKKQAIEIEDIEIEEKKIEKPQFVTSSGVDFSNVF